jgi:hypothetical protein
LRNPRRYLDVAEAAGEGLLVDVRMIEDAGLQDRAVGSQDLELVGIMLPAAVGMGDGDRKDVGAANVGSGGGL